jgi:Pvc16 N-terminal domain
VIQDVDATLKELLVRNVPLDVAAIDVRFEVPTKEWSATVTRPTVNLFLYDVRENLELRSNERFLTRSDDNKSGSESRAPVRVDFCYMITAWTTDVADEHQLLGRLLTTLLRFPVLPADVLKGTLTSQPLPMRAWIAQPERTPNPWDFWGNVEHRMKASLNFVLTVALQPFADGDVELATSTIVKVRQIN